MMAWESGLPPGVCSKGWLGVEHGSEVELDVEQLPLKIGQ
jgi:hypothetical protein